MILGFEKHWNSKFQAEEIKHDDYRIFYNQSFTRRAG